MTEARTERLQFRVEPDALARIEEQAARRGQSVSEYLRGVAVADAVDDEDRELVERLAAKSPGAVDELLALNPVSLVHRQCLGDDAALSLVLAFANHAPEAGRRKLVAALVAAVERLTATAPNVDDMGHLASIYGRRVGVA